jgi:hypothetical protein
MSVNYVTFEAQFLFGLLFQVTKTHMNKLREREKGLTKRNHERNKHSKKEKDRNTTGSRTQINSVSISVSHCLR